VRIGVYEVEGTIGQGGMGTVVRARSPEGRVVAIKVLLRQDADARARFERERRLLAAFGEADGFVPLLDLGETPDGPYLVMPLLEGGTLRARLADGPLPLDEAVALVQALARALGRAHERGVIHRDLKPENVLFDGGGKPLLADLGLAKHFRHDSPGASRSVSLSLHDAMLGTAGYMAPEQMWDAKTVSPAADVFSLGAILYECLTGEPAFKAESTVALLAVVELADHVPLATARTGTPPWLAAAVEKALAREPGARFADGGALARALAREGASRAGRSLVLAFAGLAALLALGVAIPVVAARSRAAAVDEANRARAEAERAATERQGRAHLARREEAERAEARAAKERHEKAIALAARADALLAKNDLAGALAALDEAVALDPGDATIVADRGNVRVRIGDAGGRADLDRAIELDPRLSQAWGTRGVVRLEGHDVDGAIADLTKSIELDPRSGAWCRRGEARRKKGDAKGALADFDRAIELEPAHGRAWAFRAEVKLHSGDLPGALADSARAVEVAPGFAFAHGIRGVALRDDKDPGGGLRELTKAIELGTKLAWIYSNRGLMHADVGDKPEAIADLEQAKALGLREDWLEKKLAELRAGN
jgi:tetratricopeptide (TPR) repeat protein/tRNA A-37 threonylcarbamoyl transferase component Bud32